MPPGAVESFRDALGRPVTHVHLCRLCCLPEHLYAGHMQHTMLALVTSSQCPGTTQVG